MKGVRIRDLDGNCLAFDLAELLETLGERARASEWACRVEECIARPTSSRADDLEEAFQRKARLEGADLLRLARETSQVIDGVFTAFWPGEDRAWLELAAVDSSFWEVHAADPGDLAPFRARFHDVKDLSLRVRMVSRSRTEYLLADAGDVSLFDAIAGAICAEFGGEWTDLLDGFDGRCGELRVGSAHVVLRADRVEGVALYPAPSATDLSASEALIHRIAGFVERWDERVHAG
jgi:hypothetical protein